MDRVWLPPRMLKQRISTHTHSSSNNNSTKQQQPEKRVTWASALHPASSRTAHRPRPKTSPLTAPKANYLAGRPAPAGEPTMAAPEPAPAPPGPASATGGRPPPRRDSCRLNAGNARSFTADGGSLDADALVGLRGEIFSCKNVGRQEQGVEASRHGAVCDMCRSHSPPDPQCAVQPAQVSAPAAACPDLVQTLGAQRTHSVPPTQQGLALASAERHGHIRNTVSHRDPRRFMVLQSMDQKRTATPTSLDILVIFSRFTAFIALLRSSSRASSSSWRSSTCKTNAAMCPQTKSGHS
jgi:hypothetical protein